MSILSTSTIIAFVASTNLKISRHFFADRLGLALCDEDDYALQFLIGEAKLRVAKVDKLSPVQYTVFGLEVDDIGAVVKDLSKNGIEFLRYDGFDQDQIGVCSFPGGGKVAWFKDPDGNTLSLTQKPGV